MAFALESFSAPALDTNVGVIHGHHIILPLLGEDVVHGDWLGHYHGDVVRQIS